ncbi:MAG: hypothetical protein BJ554DRAFT_3224, partial [Olpidium bornovanus]
FSRTAPLPTRLKANKQAAGCSAVCIARDLRNHVELCSVDVASSSQAGGSLTPAVGGMPTAAASGADAALLGGASALTDLTDVSLRDRQTGKAAAGEGAAVEPACLLRTVFERTESFLTAGYHFPAAVLRMLNLNADSQDAGAAGDHAAISEPIWKVLVFDRYCQDVVSSLLRVNDLRENGVTLHLYVRL